MRRAVGQLLTCPYCIGQWVAGGFTLGLVAAPRPTLLAAMFDRGRDRRHPAARLQGRREAGLAWGWSSSPAPPRASAGRPARLFAERGDRVALIARDGDGLAAAAREAAARSPGSIPVPVELADSAAVDAAARRIEDELGPIGVWVNGAMTSVVSPVGEHTPAEARGHRGDLLGAVNGTLAALARRGRATAAASCRSAPRSPTAPSRSRRPTAAPSSPCAASPTRCAASCCTTAADHGDVGPPAGAEHAPVRRGADAAAAAPAARPADLPARGGRRRDPARRRPQRRERWVGRPTIATILGERVAPALLDRYHARTGYDAQQTTTRCARAARQPRRAAARRPRLRGIFDDQALPVSYSASAREHMALTLAGVAAGEGKW